ncbi:hypothetical protein M9458_025188, partial [Cirrhinus mrigala]
EVGIRILNYLDDWLILAHSDVVLNHLARLGLRVNWEKSKLSPVQSISFLGVELDSVSMSAHLSPERAHTQTRANCPPETVSEAPGTHGILSHGYAAGFDVHETATALASYPSPEMGMALRHVPPWQDISFLRAEVPLEQVSRRIIVTTDASKTGLGRRVQRACSLRGLDRDLLKYAFPPVSLIAQTLCKVREDREQVLLVAPFWPNRTCISSSLAHPSDPPLPSET